MHVIGNENNYLFLFDGIEKQKRYDENKLLGIYSGPGAKRRFAVAKNYLHRQILKALRSYHGSNSIHKEIRNLLTDAEILYDKKLFKQSHKTIVKAKQLARGHEMHHALMEIFRHWEINLATKNADPSWIQNILREEAEEMSLLQNTKVYRTICFEIIVYYYLHGIARDEKHFRQIEKMMRNPFLLDESMAKTFEAKVRFHDAKCFYSRILNDGDGFYLSVKNIIALFKKYPEKMKQGVSFIIYLSNMIAACISNQKYSEIPAYLQEIESFAALVKSSSEKIKVFYFIASNHLNYYIITGQFPTAVSYLVKINKQLGEYEHSLSSLEKTILFHNISMSYFGAGEYKNCIYWFNRIRNEVSLSIRPDWKILLDLFYIIVQYEAGNTDLLPSLIQSVYRHLKKKRQLYKFETILIYFIRNEMPKMNTKKELTQIFQKLKNKITPLAKDPLEKNPFEFFDYVSWLESKIENRTFAEVIRQKAHPSHGG